MVSPWWFERIAVNEDQVAEYDLPTKPRKTSDVRRLDITETVEAEAMPAATLRDLLRSAIEGLLPDGAVEDIEQADEEEREGIERMAELLAEHGLTSSVDALEAQE